MRKFYLELDGVRVDLNRANGLMLVSPSGLGVTFEDTYADFENGFAVNVHGKQTMGQIVAELCFLSSAYSKYKTFVDQLLTAKNILFIYDPNGTEYKVSADLVYIQKTESYGGVYMRCPIAFNLKSLWYTEETLTGTGSISVSAGGQIPTGVKVTVSNSLTHPVLTLMEGAETVAKADVNTTTVGTFEYSNYPDDMHIIDGSGDIIRYADVTNKVFGRTRSAFTINLSGASMTAKVRRYWRTV